jgi:hypothetical protein
LSTPLLVRLLVNFASQSGGIAAAPTIARTGIPLVAHVEDIYAADHRRISASDPNCHLRKHLHILMFAHNPRPTGSRCLR